MNRRWLARELARGDGSLVGFWPLTFDFRDYSCRGSHGVVTLLNGSSNVGRAQPAGRKGFAAGTTGSSTDGLPHRYLQFPYNRAWDFEYSDPFTISGWFWRRPTERVNLFSRFSPSNTGYSFTVYEHAAVIFTLALNLGSYFTLSASDFPKTAGWHHVAVAYNGDATQGGSPVAGTGGIYYDGRPMPVTVASGSWGGGFFGTARSSSGGVVGVDDVTANAFGGGCVNLLRVYNHRLNDGQMAGLYKREREAFTRRPLTHVFVDASLSLDLFLSSIGGATGDVPLYVSGTGESGTVPLYLYGGSEATGSLSLLLGGKDGATGDIPLYTVAVTSAQHGLNLAMEADGDHATGGIDLGVFGSVHSGIGLAATLFLECGDDGSTQTRSLPLFLDTVTDGAADRHLNLFAAGEYPSAAGSVPFALCNTGGSNAADCFIAGEGGEDGFTPSARGMNLFLQRGVGNAVPLVLAAPGTNTTADTPLYVYGSHGATASCELVLPGTVGDATKSTTLFIRGS